MDFFFWFSILKLANTKESILRYYFTKQDNWHPFFLTILLLLKSSSALSLLFSFLFVSFKWPDGRREVLQLKSKWQTFHVQLSQIYKTPTQFLFVLWVRFRLNSPLLTDEVLDLKKTFSHSCNQTKNPDSGTSSSSFVKTMQKSLHKREMIEKVS